MEISSEPGALTTPRILYTLLSSPLLQPSLNLFIHAFTKSLMRHSGPFELASYIVFLKEKKTEQEKERERVKEWKTSAKRESK